MWERKERMEKISDYKKFKWVFSNKFLSNFMKDEAWGFNAYISNKMHSRVEQNFSMNLVTNFKAGVE